MYGQTIGASAAVGGTTIKPRIATYADSANPPAAIPNPQTGIALADFPASEVNESFPAWLHFGGEYRIRPEEHTAYSFTPGDNDGFFLSRLRLDLTITPTTWFEAFVQAQDSEPMGIAPGHITASVKDVFDCAKPTCNSRREKGWFSFRVGRQELRYGQERLVGVSDWTNAPRVFDGFRLVLGTSRNHVHLFSASVVVNNPVAFDNHAGGLVSTARTVHSPRSFLKLAWNPIYFGKPFPLVRSEEGTAGNENLWTYGFHWTGKLPLNFDYTIEAAKQTGNYSSDAIAAWAGYANSRLFDSQSTIPSALPGSIRLRLG